MMVDEPHQRPPFLVEFWQEKSQRFECLTQPWLHHYENTAKPTRRKGGSTSFQGFFSFSPQRTFKEIWSVRFLIMTSTKVLISMSLFLMCLMHSERKKIKPTKKLPMESLLTVEQPVVHFMDKNEWISGNMKPVWVCENRNGIVHWVILPGNSFIKGTPEICHVS